MALEIERKFLVTGEFRDQAFGSSRIRQGYISSGNGRTVRVRIRDDKGYLTIKGPSDRAGLARYEFETEISLADAQDLMAICEPGIIDKLNKNEVKFAEDENMKKAIDQLNTLAQNGYFGDNYMSDEFADAEGYMASGEFAMCNLKPGSINKIVESDLNTAGYTADDFGLFVLPILDNQVLNIHPTGPSRFIYSGSPNIDAAKQYLTFLLEKDNVQYLIDNAADVENLPVEVGQTPEYSKTTLDFLDSFDEDHKGMVLQDVVLYFNEQWMDINADLAAMFIGDMTSEEVLKALDDRRAQLAEAAGDENWK